MNVYAYFGNNNEWSNIIVKIILKLSCDFQKYIDRCGYENIIKIAILRKMFLWGK